MSQFDIHANADPRTVTQTPYLVDIQNELMDALETRIVCPVRLRSTYPGEPVSKIHVQLSVEDQPAVAFVSELAAVPKAILGPVVKSASENRDDLVGALDLLVTGF